MKLEELIGSLRTFQMNREEEMGEKKEKEVALQVEDSESVQNEDDDLHESIDMQSKNFSRVMSRLSMNDPRRRFSKGSALGVQTLRRNTSTNYNNSNAGSRNKSG